jgi:WD40 repeat protein
VKSHIKAKEELRDQEIKLLEPKLKPLLSDGLKWAHVKAMLEQMDTVDELGAQEKLEELQSNLKSVRGNTLKQSTILRKLEQQIAQRITCYDCVDGAADAEEEPTLSRFLHVYNKAAQVGACAFGMRQNQQLLGALCAQQHKLLFYRMDVPTGIDGPQDSAPLKELSLKIASSGNEGYSIAFSHAKAQGSSKHVAVAAGQQLFVFVVDSWQLLSRLSHSCTAWTDHPVLSVAYNTFSEKQDSVLAVVTANGVVSMHRSEDVGDAERAVGSIKKQWEVEGLRKTPDATSCAFFPQVKSGTTNGWSKLAVFQAGGGPVMLEKVELGSDKTNRMMQLKTKVSVAGLDSLSVFQQPVSVCAYPAVQRCSANCWVASKAADSQNCPQCGMRQEPVLLIGTTDGVEVINVRDKASTLSLFMEKSAPTREKQGSLVPVAPASHAVIFSSRLAKKTKQELEKYKERVLSCAISVDGRVVAVATEKYDHSIELPLSTRTQQMYLFSTTVQLLATVAKPVESKQEGNLGAGDAGGGEAEVTVNDGAEPRAPADVVSRDEANAGSDGKQLPAAAAAAESAGPDGNKLPPAPAEANAGSDGSKLPAAAAAERNAGPGENQLPATVTTEAAAKKEKVKAEKAAKDKADKYAKQAEDATKYAESKKLEGRSEEAQSWAKEALNYLEMARLTGSTAASVTAAEVKVEAVRPLLQAEHWREYAMEDERCAKFDATCGNISALAFSSDKLVVSTAAGVPPSDQKATCPCALVHVFQPDACTSEQQPGGAWVKKRKGFQTVKRVQTGYLESIGDRYRGYRGGNLAGETRVNALVFSADGSKLAVGGDSRILRLLDPAKPECTKDEDRYQVKFQATINACAFSPCGSILAVGLTDCKLVLFDVSTLTEMYTIDQQGAVLTCAFSRDSRVVAVGGQDEQLTLWNVKTKAVVRVFDRTAEFTDSESGECRVLSCAFPPECVWDKQGPMVVAGGSKREDHHHPYERDVTAVAGAGAELYDILAKESIQTASGTSNKGSAAATNDQAGHADNGMSGISVTADSWDREHIAQEPEHAAWGRFGSSLAEAGDMLTVKDDDKLTLYDMGERIRHPTADRDEIKRMDTLSKGENFVLACDLTHDGHRQAIGTNNIEEDALFTVWDTKRGGQMALTSGDDKILKRSGPMALTNGDDKWYEPNQIEVGQKKNQLDMRAVYATAFSKDGGIVAVGGEKSRRKGGVEIFARRDCLCIKNDITASGCVCPGYHRQTSSETAGLNTGSKVREAVAFDPLLPDRDSKVNTCAFFSLKKKSDDVSAQHLLAVGADDEELHIFDITVTVVAKGVQVEDATTARVAGLHAELTDKGAVYGIDKSLVLKVHGRVLTCAFSPNGEVLAIGDSSKQLTLFDAPKGKPGLFEQNKPRDVGGGKTSITCIGEVRTCAFAPQGTPLLAFGGPDGKITLYNHETDAIKHVFDQRSPVNCAVFSPDGVILAVGDDKRVTLYDTLSFTPLVVKEYDGYVLCVAFSGSIINGNGVLCVGGNGKHHATLPAPWPLFTRLTVSSFTPPSTFRCRNGCREQRARQSGARRTGAKQAGAPRGEQRRIKHRPASSDQEEQLQGKAMAL